MFSLKTNGQNRPKGLGQQSPAWIDRVAAPDDTRVRLPKIMKHMNPSHYSKLPVVLLAVVSCVLHGCVRFSYSDVRCARSWGLRVEESIGKVRVLHEVVIKTLTSRTIQREEALSIPESPGCGCPVLCITEP